MTSIKDSIQKLHDLQHGKSVKQEHEVYIPKKREKKENNFKLTKGILWNLFLKYQPEGYVVDKRNEKVIFTVLRYFLQDEKFNSYKLITSEPSLDKGLLIFGNYGVGKSQLFEILHEVGRELVQKAHCKNLWFNQISTGSFVDQYMEAAKDDSKPFNLKDFYKGKLYIDDLGFEKKAFNKTELLGELLFERYKKFIENRNKKQREPKHILTSRTYITTNLTPSEIRERYGDRIGDRLPEMFNILKWEGKSFRE